MIVLGNIFRGGVIDSVECKFDPNVKLNPANWIFNDGVTKPYSSRGTGQGPLEGQFEFSKQVLAFANRGSFFFKGNGPSAAKILNWNDFQQQLIIKLTQTYYSFRELYVVTETVTLADYALAISASSNGEMELASDEENGGLLEIFGHHSARTLHSKNIEYYHREGKRRPAFFKGKKLVVQPEKLEVFISELKDQRQNRDEWASSFYAHDFHYEPTYTSQVSSNTQASVLDMLQANELNINTALLYFKWEDTTLDDVEKLFQTYGY